MPDELVVTGSRSFDCAWGSGASCWFNIGGAVEPDFFFPVPPGGGGYGDLGAGPEGEVDPTELEPAPPPGAGPEPIEPEGEEGELTVTASSPTPFQGFSVAYGPSLALPAPSPRRRPPRRRPPPKKPARRTRPRRPAPGPRIKPSVIRRIASTIARLGRASNLILGILWPEDLGGGEKEFLEQYYGGFHDDESNDTRRAGPVPNFGGLPDYGGYIGGLTVTAPRPAQPAYSLPFVSPFNLPFSNSPALFGAPRDLPAVAPDQTYPVPQPRPTPRTVAPPVALPFPTPEPAPFALPSPRSGPAPRVTPRTITGPLTPLQPGVLHLPSPQPTPVEATNKCDCPPKKPKKKKQPREECREGTYRQLAKGIIYKPRRKIACQ